ncbi:hypothetical protein [Peribacillus sp. NPDC097295]
MALLEGDLVVDRLEADVAVAASLLEMDLQVDLDLPENLHPYIG